MSSVSLLRRHVPYLYLVFYLISQAVVLAQQTPTFGIVTDLRSARRARGLLVGDFNGDGITDVASYNSQQVLINYQERDTIAFHSVNAAITKPMAYAATGNFNNDKFADLVTIAEDKPEFSICLGSVEGTFKQRSITQLPAFYDNVIVADINNDGKQDLIFFTRKEPGLLVYAGTGNGSFKKPQTIFPDVAFSSVNISDINDDKINDVTCINWLTNEVQIYSGYGRMKFSNPVIIPCDHEPSFIETAHLDTNSTTDLIVGFSSDHMLKVYFGDGLGGFHFYNNIALDGQPADIYVADYHRNKRQDIGILYDEEKDLQILTNNGKGSFDEHVDFAPGKNPSRFTTFLDRRSRSVNVAILDSVDSRIRILYNDGEHEAFKKEITYSVGINPTGIYAADLDHDGWADVIIGNTGSQNFGIFRNRKDGTLDGQIIYPVAMDPTRVRYYPKNDSTAAILLTGKFEEKISVSEINLRDYSQTAYSIPTQQDPLILGILSQNQSSNFDIFALEYERRTEKYSITKFEQSSRKRFIEKNYTPAGNLLSACVMDGTSGQRGSIIYMTYDQKKKIVLAFRSEATDQRKNTPAKFLFSIPCEESPRLSLWSGDINNDGISDLVINMLDPENQLLTSLGKRDSSFTVPQLHLTDAVSVSHHDRLKIIDVNGDQMKDIVLDNDLDRSIQVYLGKGDGTFAPKIRLISTVGLGGFEVCDINHDSLPELILVDNANGYLRIIPLNQ